MTILDMSKDAITLADDLVYVDVLLTDIHAFLTELDTGYTYEELRPVVQPLLRRIEKY